MTSNANTHTSSEPNRTPPAPDISGVGRTYELEEDRQEINKPTCSAKGTSRRLLEEKRREDLKSETETGVIALNVLVPIKQLSDDVLCHIFKLHCKDSLPATFKLPRKSLWRPTPPKIALSHVCSAWRDVMLDVPTFWRSIRIRIVSGNLNTPRTIERVKAANTWLSRAKGLPCSIDIDFPEDSESLWGMDWHENIIRDLISLHKFKTLSVTFADHHLRDLLQLPDDNLSCVEDLCVRYISLDEDDTALPLDLHKLSNLKSFSLLPNPFDLYSLNDPSEGYFEFTGIPWHNLQHIQLRATTPVPFCLDVLGHCSAVLETCSLVITEDHTFTPSPPVPVHLFQLRKLEVVVYSNVEELLESFLLSLRFPNLKSLTLAGSSDYPIDLEILLKVQNASQMQLEELIIPESTLDVDVDVSALLTGFPSLRRLELPSMVTFTDEAMIEIGAGSIGIFLEHLTINDSDLDLETLLQMIKARSRAGDRDGKRRIEATEFKSVTLHRYETEDEIFDEILDFIEEIKRAGVDLNVIFASESDKESELDSFDDDYSDASSDDEAIDGDIDH